MDTKDVGTVLMAICNLEGIWDSEMRIPPPNRKLLVEHAFGKWDFDERGFPKPSADLLAEIAQLERREAERFRLKAEDET